MKARELVINEIFYSLQGESTQAGRPCVFVRLMGCPLRCQYCDTAYAFTEGQKQSFDQVLDEIKKYPTKLVELTGGEPLAQANAKYFLQELVNLGYEVMIETSGAFSVAELPKEVKVILDIKTPGSKELARMEWDNMGFLKPHQDEVKFVICDRADFDFACEVANRYKLFDRVEVLISPSWNQVKLPDLSAWVLESGLPFRMQVQLHKFIWGAEVRGV